MPYAVIGDATRLRQVLVNLVGNAVKFTGQGEVVVSAAVEEQNDQHHIYRFSVRDTGIGIPADRRDRLFQSFSQVDESTTRKYGGTGLGLAISKRLVEAMGGRIWVESVEGIGTTFHFTVVLEVDEAAEREACCGGALVGRRLLIVDDNAANRHLLVSQVRRWGLHAEAVASGSEALDLLARDRSFDLLLLDCHMPGMDGVTLAQSIAERYTGLPMILLSSVAEIGTVPQDLFQARLTKPVRHEQLCHTIARALKHAVDAPTSRSKDAPDGPDLSSAEASRVLVAEDNAVNQLLIKHMLDRFGYRADIVADGSEVLHALEEGMSYDLILMDLRMPILDGLETARQIRKIYPEDDRPQIVAMTADVTSEKREECFNAGMVDFVSKPLMKERLEAIVKRYLSSGPHPMTETVQH